jgi:hypothetical protein
VQDAETQRNVEALTQLAHVQRARPFPSEANRWRQRLETANGLPALMPTARAPCSVCSTTTTREAPRSSTATSRAVDCSEALTRPLSHTSARRQVTLDGIGRATDAVASANDYASSSSAGPRDDRLSARAPAPGEASAVASSSSMPSSSGRALDYPLHRATSTCRERQLSKPG